MEALEQVTLVTKSDGEQNCNNETDAEAEPSKNFAKWEAALVNAFRVMDKEIKLQQDLDCSSSGSTAVVVIRQVKRKKTMTTKLLFLLIFSWDLIL